MTAFEKLQQEITGWKEANLVVIELEKLYQELEEWKEAKEEDENIDSHEYYNHHIDLIENEIQEIEKSWEINKK